MIGSGTGIAPFRSFVQQRATDEAEGKNWLIFGNQHFASDFLYQPNGNNLLKTASYINTALHGHEIRSKKFMYKTKSVKKPRHYGNGYNKGLISMCAAMLAVWRKMLIKPY
ncbi:sulfite reductase (NADPH) flavoprotein alpha-component [Actinobacillus pleuropneumoniae]|nr:sulfite reductase (NADPH) flavoprotein alpha-component [Actinobacillus pleuropneumoniae]